MIDHACIGGPLDGKMQPMLNMELGLCAYEEQPRRRILDWDKAQSPLLTQSLKRVYYTPRCFRNRADEVWLYAPEELDDVAVVKLMLQRYIETTFHAETTRTEDVMESARNAMRATTALGKLAYGEHGNRDAEAAVDVIQRFISFAFNALACYVVPR